jgi:hypothetical protein
MLSILPLVFLFLCARWSGRRQRETGPAFDVRDALLVGAVCTGAWAVIGAELLSAFHRFDRTAVAGWWVAGLVIAGLGNRLTPSGNSNLGWKPDPSRFNVLLVVIGVAILVCTGVLAFATPPSTPDVLCYHLPRQVYWIHNHTVAHFPAYDLRQLEMPPMAEFLGAQLMLLSGNDYQANLVQWFSYLLSGLAASAIARDMGAGAAGQSFAALLALLNPAAATQSVNAKNDIVVGLWALALVWATARLWISRKFSPGSAVFMGAALGLLLLTKGTGYVIGPAVCVVIAAAGFRASPRRAPLLGAVIIVIACAANAPHWIRNYRAFGSPIALPAAKGGFGLGNDVHTPAVVISNAVRTITLHTNSPWQGFNTLQERVVERVHQRIRIDPIDRRTTPSYVEKFTVGALWANDGNNPAPVHLLLGAGMLFALRPRQLRRRLAWPVFVIPYICGLMFVYLLKWQPCNVRLHIPIVALAAPVLAVWLTRRPWVILVSVLATGFLSTCGLAWNDAKPLVGKHSIIGKSREEMMYLIQTRPNELSQARKAVADIAAMHPESVALDVQAHTNEYSVMRMLLDTVVPPPKLTSFRQVHGPRIEGVAPEAVLKTWSGPAGAIFHEPSRTRFQCTAIYEPFKTYRPAESVGQWKLTSPIPEFIGWESEVGLRPAEGPHAHFDLPVVRWAKEAFFQLAFDSDGSPAVLIMEVRRNETSNQEMTVSLNKAQVHRLEFGNEWAFLPVTVFLTPKKGPNILRCEFANLQEPGPPHAALFRKLQIIPAAWLKAAPEETSPP